MCPNILLNQNKHELKRRFLKTCIYMEFDFDNYIHIQFLQDINYMLKID